MNKLMLLSILFLSSLAVAEQGSIPNEVFSELQKFTANGQALSSTAVQEIPLRIHETILNRQRDFFESLKGQCQETIKITFGPKVMENTDASIRSFEAGLVRIEASKCYANASPKDLIRISGSANFKKRAFPTLRQITVPSENVSCETTAAPTIGKSQYCYLSVDLEDSETSASQVSFLTYNNDSSPYDAPIYFREAFVSARKMGSQTLYYVNSYVRSKEMSSFQRFFAKDYIAKIQEQVFTELGNSIRIQNLNPDRN